MNQSVTIAPSPASYKYYHQDGAIVIIVDILRATTSIVTALYNGAHGIIPVGSTDEAKSYLDKGYLVGGERNGQKCSFAHFGNDPFDYMDRSTVMGKEIVLTTTNGTQAIEAAAQYTNTEIIIGAFGNISSISEYLNETRRPITILTSGWKNQLCIEDLFFAGALIYRLRDQNNLVLSDLSQIALEQYIDHSSSSIEYIKRCEHYNRLKAINAHKSIEYCLTKDHTPIIPFYTNGHLIQRNKR